MAEEEKFYETLDKGLGLLEKELKPLKPGSMLSGEVVFKLYDTYGFPLDLTQSICKERQYAVDENGFNLEMEKQRKMARDARNKNTNVNVAVSDKDLSALKIALSKIRSEFIGYDATSCSSNAS